MKLTILGSGTYQPDNKRHTAGYLVQTNKQNIVFDFGRGTLDQLLALNIHYYDIAAIFISHMHPDHASELISFLHIALAEPGREIGGKRRVKDITIYGPKKIKKQIAGMLKIFSLSGRAPKKKVILKELANGDRVRGRGWKLHSFRAEHGIEALSFRLESTGKIFAYSGDTKDCPGLRQACKDADVAVIETSWPEKMKPKTHMSGDATAKLAQESGIKKLVATHIAPYYLSNFDVRADLKKHFTGKIIVAKDLLSIKI